MPQTAFGPLIEPGWNSQKMPEPLDVGKTFLNAFQVGASINAKQQALERQLALYALKAQGMENERNLDQARFDLATKKQAQDYELKLDAAGRAEDYLSIANERFKLNDLVQTTKIDEQKKDNEDERGFGEYVVNCGTRPGTLEHVDCLRRAKLLFPRAEIKQHDIDTIKDKTASETMKSLQSEKTLILSDAGEDLNLPGGRKWDNAKFFLEPESTPLRVFETEPSEAEKRQGRKPTPAAENSHMRVDSATGLQTEVKFRKDSKGAYIDTDYVGMFLPPIAPGMEGSYTIVSKSKVKKYYDKLSDVNKRIESMPAKASTTPTSPGAPFRIYTQADYIHASSGQKLVWTSPDGTEVEFVKP